jgi:hypothetical protein
MVANVRVHVLLHHACMYVVLCASVIYYLLRRNVNGFLGNISGNSNILIILKIVIIM